MDSYDFTEEEIKEQLNKLGFHDVSEERLLLFKKDLAELVALERSKNSDLFSNGDSTSSDVEVIDAGVRRKDYHPLHYPSHDPKASTHTKHTNQECELGRAPHGSSSVSSLHGDGVTVPKSQYHSRPVDHRLIEQSLEAKNTSLDTTSSSDRRQIKRKVLRKKDGHSHIFDESVTESETDDLSSLQERLMNLRVVVNPRPVSAGEVGSRGRSHWRPSSSTSEPVYRLPEDYMGPKALIRPMSKDPHQQNVRKSDPVSQYHKYQSSWTQQRAPGDRAHKDLRWSVREHMLYQDDIIKKKTNKVYVPNGYRVPSDKKRKNLRWQIRNDLAQGIVPPSVFD